MSRSFRARLDARGITLAPEPDDAPVRHLTSLPQAAGSYTSVLPDGHPWKNDQWLDRWRAQNHTRVRPIDEHRTRFDMRLTNHMRGQLNDLIRDQNVSGSEIIRRAIAEYHWRYVLGKVLPATEDLALEAGD